VHVIHNSPARNLPKYNGAILISMRPMRGGMAINARLDMNAERPISAELTELSRREQMLRQAGEELLQEADLLRQKYDKILAEVNRTKDEEDLPEKP
jgi:hypothetical protein